MRLVTDHFIEKLKGLPIKEQFLSCVEKNNDFLANRCVTFMHRDYHSRNLMVVGREVVVIDFQDAMLGPLSYDIVSLLWDPYVRIGEQDRKSLLELWKNGIKKAEDIKKLGLLDDLDEEVDRMIVQRFLKVCGSFASFISLNNDDSYLPCIPPSLEAVDAAIWRLLAPHRELVCEDRAELKELLEILSKISQ